MLVKMRELEPQRDGLVKLLDFTGLEGITMIEVGSYAGESADTFASSGKVKALFCIDPWQGGYDSKDVASSSDFTEVEAAFDKVMEKHPVIIRKYKGTLEQFVKEHPQVKPDLIYIDACHTYEGCAADLIVAQGLEPRFIAGHDYCEGWAGVKRAVDEKVGTPDSVFED